MSPPAPRPLHTQHCDTRVHIVILKDITKNYEQVDEFNYTKTFQDFSEGNHKKEFKNRHLRKQILFTIIKIFLNLHMAKNTSTVQKCTCSTLCRSFV